MENKYNSFKIDNNSWPEYFDPISSTFLKFDFNYCFTKNDLKMLRDEEWDTFLGYRWIYISDEKIYIHRGGTCVYQLCINPTQNTHSAVYYFYDYVDPNHGLNPQNELYGILSKWFNHGWHAVVDCHGHYNFGVDDGSLSPAMSLNMIYSAYLQGVSDIICTSHSWCSIETYKSNLSKLQSIIKDKGIKVNLYSGSEIFCSEDWLHDIIIKLNSDQLIPLGKSKYVLLEFDSNTDSEEILRCIKAITELTDYKPVIAHAERYRKLACNTAINVLKSWKTPIQINAYSLVEEKDPAIRNFARELLRNRMVTFVGSDAHRTIHRAPNLQSGIEFIYENCGKHYADAICYENARQMILSE